MPPADPEFGRAVTALLDERGLSLRAAEERTGVSYGTIQKMRRGHVPKFALLQRFIAGLELDAETWRTLAGYEAPLAESGAEVFYRGLRQLAARGVPPGVSVDWSRLPAELSVDEARALLAEIEAAATGR